MVTSIDGKLHPSRFTGPAAGVDAGRLRKHYDEVSAKFGAQGWMCGRVTMQEISKGKARPVTEPGITSREPFVGDRRDRDLAISIDPHGKVHYGQDHLHGDHAVAVLSETVSDTYLAELRRTVCPTCSRARTAGTRQAMDALGETFGVETLLLEGGAAINGAFLKAGLIDEISVLITGGRRPRRRREHLRIPGPGRRAAGAGRPSGTCQPRRSKAGWCGYGIRWRKRRPSQGRAANCIDVRHMAISSRVRRGCCSGR